MDLTREQALEFCKDACPHCKADAPLRKREDTGEFVHDAKRIDGHVSHFFCLAHYFRNKYESVLSG